MGEAIIVHVRCREQGGRAEALKPRKRGAALAAACEAVPVSGGKGRVLGRVSHGPATGSTGRNLRCGRRGGSKLHSVRTVVDFETEGVGALLGEEDGSGKVGVHN